MVKLTNIPGRGQFLGLNFYFCVNQNHITRIQTNYHEKLYTVVCHYPGLIVLIL